jgi:hypothetical protein
MELCLDVLRYKMIRETERFLQGRLKQGEQKPAAKPLLPSGVPPPHRLGDRRGTRGACASGSAATALTVADQPDRR